MYLFLMTEIWNSTIDEIQSISLAIFLTKNKSQSALCNAFDNEGLKNIDVKFNNNYLAMFLNKETI